MLNNVHVQYFYLDFMFNYELNTIHKANNAVNLNNNLIIFYNNIFNSQIKLY